jgi:hypothetical protein
MTQHEQAAMSQAMSASSTAAEKEQKKREYDEAAAAAVFQKLNADVAAKAEKDAAKAAKLAAAAVADADVTIVQHELALPTAAAAKALLQQHNGNLEATLRAALGIKA